MKKTFPKRGNKERKIARTEKLDISKTVHRQWDLATRLEYRKIKNKKIKK